MFAPHLKRVIDGVDGGIAAVIMGLDGIAVEQYERARDKADITTVAMEFSFILGQVRKAADSLRIGGCDELTIRAQGLTLITRMLTPQYFLAVAIGPEANFGKARFLTRLAAPQLTANL